MAKSLCALQALAPKPAAVAATNAPAPKAGGDAFWTGLSDMHRRRLGRAATLHHLAAQRDGLSKALKGASSAALSLPTDEAAFLRGNLIHQAGIMVQICERLAQVETAAEALDRGDRAGCAAALDGGPGRVRGDSTALRSLVRCGPRGGDAGFRRRRPVGRS